MSDGSDKSQCDGSSSDKFETQRLDNTSETHGCERTKANCSCGNDKKTVQEPVEECAAATSKETDLVSTKETMPEPLQEDMPEPLKEDMPEPLQEDMPEPAAEVVPPVDELKSHNAKQESSQLPDRSLIAPTHRTTIPPSAAIKMRKHSKQIDLDANSDSPLALIGKPYVFFKELIGIITKNESQENVLFSPLSIQCCFALVLIASNGETSDEIRRALRIDTADKDVICESFQNYLKSIFLYETPLHSSQLRMANHIYVDEKLKISQNFTLNAQINFHSNVNSINFANGLNATNIINGRMAKKTHKKIRNFLYLSDINEFTNCYICNSIIFTGFWETPFARDHTKRREFYISTNESVDTEMMNMINVLKYMELSDIDCKVIEMKFKLSNISMMIFLPNQIEGLSQLEKAMVKLNWNQLRENMPFENVEIYLPKFEIDYCLDLRKTMSEMGVTKMFSDGADLSDFLSNSQNQKISEARHRVVLNISETGTENVISAYPSFQFDHEDRNCDMKLFCADHPFAFIIRNHETIIFVGHVISINPAV